jgi:A/G-specific adenine glycosylase
MSDDHLQPRPSDLLEWFDLRRRDLPWRSVDDPYAIWVSEVMLQQTRAETVIPYFREFLRRFPDVGSLAGVPVDDVLALWSGLGYYRRARLLHAAAREIVTFGGEIPGTAGELERLPGIGPYTAAAVASIAFGEVVPVLDGNVERLLARYVALAEDPRRRASREVLLAKAAELLDPSRPGDSNQAMMELGATVCLPRRPRCDSCPLAPACLGRSDPERYPPRRRRRRVEESSWSLALVERREKVLFFRRPESSDLLPGMWELPNVARGPDLRSTEAALGRAYGGRWRLGGELFRVRHGITYRSLTLHVHPAERVAGGQVAESREAAWISDDERPGFAVASLFEKVLARR